MTFRSHIFKAMTLGLVILALGASATWAAPMTHRERQAVASHGVGAPTPKIPADVRQIDLGSPASIAPAQPDASDGHGVAWGIIAIIVGAATAACIALLALLRRRATVATPR